MAHICFSIYLFICIRYLAKCFSAEVSIFSVWYKGNERNKSNSKVVHTSLLLELPTLPKCKEVIEYRTETLI